jgi:hypothetical protein
MGTKKRNSISLLCWVSEFLKFDGTFMSLNLQTSDLHRCAPITFSSIFWQLHCYDQILKSHFYQHYLRYDKTNLSNDG